MKQILIYTLVALFAWSCSTQQTPEMRQQQIDNINKKIRKLETKKQTLVSALDTAQVERIYPVRLSS
jgi:hypothetical protein